MIAIRVEVPYASFRKSYARSFAETYPLPPPATVYGMLLSLVGERLRSAHAGVGLAFAYANLPKVSTTLRKLSRFKYGVPTKKGLVPDYIATLSDLQFLCWIDSTAEQGTKAKQSASRLEERITNALEFPESIERTGVLCLGCSDDAVDTIEIAKIPPAGKWQWLSPKANGSIDLPVWVDHVGAIHTRWQRYEIEEPGEIKAPPSPERFTRIVDPR